MTSGPREYMGATSAPITNRDELADLASLRERLRLVPAHIERWDRVARTSLKPRSQIGLDDAHTGWRHLSHGATLVLNQAADHLRVLHEVLPPDGPFTLPMVAHYPVARAALEAASVALWILGPDDARERIDRHLRNAAREVRDEADFTSALDRLIENDTEMPFTRAQVDRFRKERKAWKRKHNQQIRACARQLGLPDPTLGGWPVGFAEIIREATAHTGMKGDYGEMVWRQISGLSHPSSLRSVRFLSMETVAEYGGGIQGVRLTSDMNTVKSSVEAALLQFRTACEAFGVRKLRAGDPGQYVARAGA